MNKGRIIIISGPPGTGKSTISNLLSKESDNEKSVYLQTDDFYHYISKGYIPPYLKESNDQNLTVIESFLACSKRFADSNYDIYIDGIVGPWFIEPFKNISEQGYRVHYIVLRADYQTTLERATNRKKLSKEENIQIVKVMYEPFKDLKEYESHVLDTTNLTVDETIDSVRQIIENNKCLL